MRSSSPFIARAVSAITGMARVVSSPFSNTVASSPSMPGSWMSIRIRSGCSSRAKVRPASASVALSTVCPADCSRNTPNVMLVALSSTISTLAMSGDQRPPRHGPPHFGHEAVASEVDLLHDHFDIAVQLGTVLDRDLLGGEDQDRNAAGVRVLL